MASDFAYCYALWKMGELPPEDVPKIACTALEKGLDSPALRYLAGLDKPTFWEIRQPFDDACAQLGIIPASTSEVERRKKEAWLHEAIQRARSVSTEILKGTVDPAEGWLRLPYREGGLGPLSVFFEFAEPGGSLQFNDEFRSRVVEAAKRFLSSGE